MTPAQVTKTQIEYSKAWKARQSVGGADQLTREGWRMSLKIRSGAVNRKGKPLSSRGMNNHHVDRFLRLCKSYSEPANLKAQLDLDAQPVLRVLTACAPLLDLIEMHEEDREAYIAGIYRNTQRKRIREEESPELSLHEMPDEDLGKVIAALTHTVEHKLGVAHNHPRTGKGAISRHAHRVGQKSAGQKPASQSRTRQNLSTPEPNLFDPANPF